MHSNHQEITQTDAKDTVTILATVLFCARVQRRAG